MGKYRIQNTEVWQSEFWDGLIKNDGLKKVNFEIHLRNLEGRSWGQEEDIKCFVEEEIQ